MNHDVKLFPSQLKVIRSQAEIILLLAARGTGKSTVATYWVLRKFAEQPHVMGFIGTPSHAQTNDLMTKLVNLLANLGIPYIIGKRPPDSWGSTLTDHKQYLSVLMPGNKLAQCRYATLENYEASRGISVGWILIDEAALIKEIAYKEVLVPALRGYGTNHKYQQLLLTTPKGISNWASELIDNPHVEVIRAASAENFIEFTDEKIAMFKDMMSDRQFRQEILGEIVTISDNSQYHAFNLRHVKDMPIDDSMAYAICSDQNVSPLVANIIKFNKERVYVLDEIYIEGGATVADLTAEICKKEYLKGKTIKLYGDRSGNNKSVVSDQSFYRQLIARCAAKGITLVDRTLMKNPNVYESRELVNSWLEKDKLHIHPRCAHLIKDFEKAHYDEQFKTNKKIYDPHCADGLAYFFWKEHGKAPMQALHFSLV